MEQQPRNEHSLAALMGELRDETTTLLRQEVALAKAEMSEKTARLARNSVYIALGAMIAYAALVVLLLAVRDLLAVALTRAGIASDVAVWLAPVIVGVAVGVVGWAMIAKGKKALANEGVVPEKTVASLREDKEWARQKIQRT